MKINLSTPPRLQKILFGENFIISIKESSIMEHLSVSHVPELLIRNNLYKHIFLSKKSISGFDDIYNLIWKNNPYITGIVDSGGWKRSYRNFNRGADNKNTLDSVVYQLTGTTPMAGSTHPKIYKTERFQTFKNEHYILVDLNGPSKNQFLNIPSICKYLEDSIKSTQGRIDTIYLYQNPFINKIFDTSSLLQKLASAKLLKIISIEKNLNDYTSRIKYAKHVFCLYSDTSFLASALGTPTTVFCMPKDSSRSFDNQSYISL